MTFSSDIAWSVLILAATLVMSATCQNYDVYSYNFDQQSNRVSNVVEQKSCDQLSAVHLDQNGPYGSISIPNPDYQNIVIKAIYSVAARLPSVRSQVLVVLSSVCFQRKKLAWKFPLKLFL